MGKRLELKDLIEAVPLDERDARTIFQVIRTAVEGTPELLEELFPGKRLQTARLSPAQRAKRATAHRVAQAGERHDRVMPIIKRILQDDPEASLADIKVILDNSGVTPARSAKWSRATINFIMTKAGLRDAEG